MWTANINGWGMAGGSNELSSAYAGEHKRVGHGRWKATNFPVLTLRESVATSAFPTDAARHVGRVDGGALRS
jgi:hypothetical protein